MAGVVNGIGLLSGVFTIISFLDGVFPGADEAKGGGVQIKSGRNDSATNLGGNIADVYGYDADNKYVGRSGPASMSGDGDFVNVIVAAQPPGVQLDYVTVSNSDDATCVAWITVTQYDGTKGGGWTGDIGAQCGADFYANNQKAGTYDDGSPYKPFCTWIDADHTNDFKYAALKFDVDAYGANAQDTIDSDAGCDSTIFGPDSGPINDAPSKRTVKPRKQWMIDQIVKSNEPSHSAEVLCNATNSYGPDFIDSKGMFCDMGSKTLSKMCSVEPSSGCVDLEAQGEKTNLVKRSFSPKRGVDIVHKTYTHLVEWEE